MKITFGLLLGILLATLSISSLQAETIRDKLTGQKDPKQKANRPKRSNTIQRLLGSITPPWSDFKPYIDLPSSSNPTSQFESSDSNNRSNDSKTSLPSLRSTRISFDDSAQKNGAPSSGGSKSLASGGSNSGGTPAGNQPDMITDSNERSRSSNESIAFPLWYPVCLWMDGNAVSEDQGNSTTKQLVDEAAGCGVNLVVFPFAVDPGSYPRSAGGANALQTRACNAPGRLDNASRASTSLCVDSGSMADEMCGSPSGGVAGCASLQSGGDGGLDDAQKARLKAHLGGSISYAGEGSAAPSIEDIGACDGGTVGHEALGHSMWGHPNGAGDGHGIGGAAEGGSGGAAGGTGGGWTGAGCAAMRGSAFENSGRWKYNPNQEKYFVKPKDPEQWWDLSSERKLFPDEPPGGSTTGDPSNLSIASEFSSQRFLQGSGGSGKPKKESQSSSSGATALSVTATPGKFGDPHKKRPGTTMADVLLERAQEGSSERENTSRGRDSLPNLSFNSSQGANKRISFDDSAQKNLSNNSSSSNSKSTDSLYGRSQDFRSLSEDTTNPIKSTTLAGTSNSISAGAKISFDDNRQKGASVSTGGGQLSLDIGKSNLSMNEFDKSMGGFDSNMMDFDNDMEGFNKMLFFSEDNDEKANFEEGFFSKVGKDKRKRKRDKYQRRTISGVQYLPYSNRAKRNQKLKNP